ncbi:hypothetical protein OG562_02165 [Streptomyces sp. NBC_01275]|uniref:hypothetical protein n=1 Tax=Streptomyces sp. NBC_01275 TaxID=2903807 RepID=UPI00225B455A|nr:hypothetical protein [Streptomyces sp. NBC_01275]MCX4759812.1 hypothetical protein [Streptomyces sp. NBC_01275]
MRIRYAAAACAGAAVLGSLTGCTVPGAGAMGITVTSDGQPVGVLMVCHDHLDGATLYTDTDTGDDTEDVATWSHPKSLTGFTAWPLATGGGGWTIDRPMPATLERQRTYTLYGWTEDNSWSANEVTFTLAQLAALTPGRVRYYHAGDGSDSDRDGYRTASVGDFRADACRNS